MMVGPSFCAAATAAGVAEGAGSDEADGFGAALDSGMGVSGAGERVGLGVRSGMGAGVEVAFRTALGIASAACPGTAEAVGAGVGSDAVFFMHAENVSITTNASSMHRIFTETKS